MEFSKPKRELMYQNYGVSLGGFFLAYACIVHLIHRLFDA